MISHRQQAYSLCLCLACQTLVPQVLATWLQHWTFGLLGPTPNLAYYLRVSVIILKTNMYYEHNRASGYTISASAGVWILSSESRKIIRCIWGSPCSWNSIVCTIAMTFSNIPPFLISSSKASFFNWKTLATISGQSSTFWSDPSVHFRASTISGHCGFTVIVRKISGFCKALQIAIESWYS